MMVDVAVDPLDGTSLVAGGRNGAVAVRTSAAHYSEHQASPVPVTLCFCFSSVATF